MPTLDKHLGLRLPAEQVFRLKLSAALQGVSASELVRRLLERELAQLLPPERELGS